MFGVVPETMGRIATRVGGIGPGRTARSCYARKMAQVCFPFRTMPKALGWTERCGQFCWKRRATVPSYALRKMYVPTASMTAAPASAIPRIISRRLLMSLMRISLSRCLMSPAGT